MREASSRAGLRRPDGSAGRSAWVGRQPTGALERRVHRADTHPARAAPNTRARHRIPPTPGRARATPCRAPGSRSSARSSAAAGRCRCESASAPWAARGTSLTPTLPPPAGERAAVRRAPRPHGLPCQLGADRRRARCGAAGRRGAAGRAAETICDHVSLPAGGDERARHKMIRSRLGRGRGRGGGCASLCWWREADEEQRSTEERGGKDAPTDYCTTDCRLANAGA